MAELVFPPRLHGNRGLGQGAGTRVPATNSSAKISRADSNEFAIGIDAFTGFFCCTLCCGKAQG